MCGIFAVYGNGESGDFEAQRKKFLACSKKIRHRGPDWNGIYINNTTKAVLCHERLSIIDIENGAQPLPDDRNEIYLTVNGEIYNHKGLKEYVLQNSYDFKTQSDCEVIIPLYKQYHNNFLNMLDGVFSFVLYDSDSHDLIVGRDPIGVNPLYYAKNDIGEFCFSSEIKAIREWNTNCKIEIFPPGHFMDKTLEPQRYYFPKWYNSKFSKLEHDISERVICNRVRDVLTKSVKKRLMTDVPFGVLLSGGLDSSLITSITHKLLNENKENNAWGNKLHSFSIGLKGAPDLKYAKEVADSLGTIHHELYFTVQEGLDAIRDLVYQLETYDVTTIRASTPMYLLSRKIKAMGIKMVLSGEGADEILGGYLYFHNAPSLNDFHEECKNRVKGLHHFDCLRANKSTMSWGLEVRVPFLDKEFLDVSIPISPNLKLKEKELGDSKNVEKYILRKAFSKEMNDENYQYLPDSVLWRQKEQFSDGVGYNWVDSLQEFTNSSIPDEKMENLNDKYPLNTPTTKEGVFYREIFEELFPNCSNTSKYWIPNTKWEGVNADPSGRVQGVHLNQK